MPTFTVIYEFSPFHVLGTPLTFASLIVLGVSWYVAMAWGFWRGAALFLAGVVLLAWPWWHDVQYHLITIEHVRSGRIAVVEGEVSGVRTIDRTGRQAFVVGGVTFGESSVVRPGFAANEKGPALRNGLYARVHYFDMPVIGYEVRPLRVITKFELRRP
jgi:hypothetical protein